MPFPDFKICSCRVKRHKDDCMCAICIMKRRRREREAREAQEAREAGAQATSSQTEFTKTGLPQESKQEVGLVFVIN